MSQPSSRPVPPQQGLHARHQRAYAAASHRFHTTLAAQPPLIDHDVLVRERPVVDALRLKLAQLTERRELYAKGSLQTLEITEQFMELRVDYDLRFWRSFRVNDLPPEIILEIIRYACWSHGDGVRPRSTVTQTCRLWRQLALGDSMLWSAIYFRMADFPFRRCYAWMDRAGRAPLHIRFDDGGQGEGERHITDQEIRPFLDRLFEHIYHVQSLIIIVSDWEPLLTFVKRLHAISRIGRPLIIQRLEIHRSGDLYVWPGANRIIKGHDVTLYPALGGPVAPMLEWLSFDGIHFDWPASSISNLTTLDLRRLPLELAPSRKSFREMLYSSPKLLRLTLDGAGPKEFFDPACTIPPIRLNNLKILILCNFSPVYVKGILQNISAPNVQDLQIMCFMRNDYKDVWSFMSGQFPNVKILVMLKIDIQMPDGLHALTRLLASMPKVRYLRMSSITPGTITALLRDGKTTRLHPGISSVSRELFANLRIPDANMTSKPDANGPVFVFPQLKVMEVQDLPPAELVALVESRRRIGMPLVKVYIKGEQLKRMNSNIHKLIVDNNCLCEPLPNSQTTTKEEVAVLDEESFRKMYNLSQAPTPASFTR